MEHKKKMLACKATADIKGLEREAAFIKKSMNMCKDDKCKKCLTNELQNISQAIEENKEYLK